MSAAETFRAFPSSAIDDLHGGMSLSDWFAGQALAGLTACPTMRNMKNADYARVSYALADAMMAERAKGGAPDPNLGLKQALSSAIEIAHAHPLDEEQAAILGDCLAVLRDAESGAA